VNRVLVIEDEDIIRKQITLLLERHNYEVTGVGNVDEACANHPQSFDVILADIRLPGADGTEIIHHSEQVPVILMTSYASVRSAVESMKLGAVNYISKPFDHEELLLVIARSLHENRISAQNAAMKKDLERVFPRCEISVENPSMKAVVDQLAALPVSDLHVFLEGERGTGKELLARYCHDSGERAVGPLVFADLPMYPENEIDAMLFGSRRLDSDVAPASGHGLLQSAHAGTLVLRNVLSMPLDAQRKLIELTSARTQRHGRMHNVRIIALASQSLDTSVKAGQLDSGFAALFAQHSYLILPLKNRREDQLPLARHYLDLFVKRYRKRKISFSGEALNALQAYQWPGNITELKSVVERAVLMVETDEIKPAHLGIGVIDGTVKQVPFDLSLDAYFRYFVLNFQEQFSETELASKLGISRKALWERRQKMDLPRA